MKGTPKSEKLRKRVVFGFGALFLLVLSPGFLAQVMVQSTQVERIFGTGLDSWRYAPLPGAPESVDNIRNIARDGLPVPRVYLSNLPEALVDLEVRDRKTAFNATLLPLVLRANEEILADRARLLSLRNPVLAKDSISATDRDWLQALGTRYRVEKPFTPRGIQTLIRRVDIIPPSLALAQAAIESGWGTSRFAQEGNALYGQWIWGDGAGIVPTGREEGQRHKIRAFDTLYDSVRAYMLNLNRHYAYEEFRRARRTARADGTGISGGILLDTLEAYSTRRDKYVDELRIIIAANDYSGLDDAELEPPWWRTN